MIDRIVKQDNVSGAAPAPLLLYDAPGRFGVHTGSICRGSDALWCAAREAVMRAGDLAQCRNTFGAMSQRQRDHDSNQGDYGPGKKLSAGHAGDKRRPRFRIRITFCQWHIRDASTGPGVMTGRSVGKFVRVA